MHQDHHRVKIPSDVLGNDSPSLQPPLPSGGKGVIGDKEIGAGPRSEARPNLLCKLLIIHRPNQNKTHVNIIMMQAQHVGVLFIQLVAGLQL